jgi:hypothetical protein
MTMDSRDIMRTVAVLAASTDGPGTAALYLMEAAAELLAPLGRDEVADFFELFVEERLRNAAAVESAP